MAEVRIFARYVQALDPATEVPPPGLLPVRTRRLIPYLYSDGEIAALMAGARVLEPELWGATCETILGLLWSSGMRVGEALRLDRADVSFAEGRLTVWRTKFKKSRHVPLSPSTLAALASYDQVRRRCCPRPATARFFVSRRGGPVPYMALRDEFVRLLERTGVPWRHAAQRPRIHDLRHSFSVRTLLGWYRSGADVGALMPRLSSYLGHSGAGVHLLVFECRPRADGARRRAARKRGGPVMSALAPCLEAFFTERLGRQLQASPCTVGGYRDTFRLLSRFAAERAARHRPPSISRTSTPR